ncbi:cutinase transcription factor 1 beta [Coniochaeta sp. PMI_546]|nr:cutinase transcription factor 1 beta [Coniochaeta sp. PMI_546]
MGDIRTAQFLNTLEEPDLLAQLPAFVRPLPSKIAPEDVKYLYTKGALTLPPLELQNALIRAFVEYVHPYMPLVELGAFLNIINAKDGLCGQISLFLYQAVMFSATAYVETKYLRAAGYTSRRAARKSFFHKTRLLYDFDYESDRLVLVQALLLMTYWYETPDDQKDTWHWMGVAISLAHTIGLHRNPANSLMPVRKQKLWKRIWWSCFMRDRLIALGMRRPTRIQDGDFDVPMLQEDDFEIEVLSEQNELLPAECRVVRDLDMQRELALMCIEKAKLCVCVSHMLKAQYSVLNRDGMRADNTTDSTMMLFPNKTLDNVENVHKVDMELMNWFSNLPQICEYRPLTPFDVQNGRATVAVQRNLLHMVYHTTVSALHRPQFLPASQPNAPPVSRQIQEMSRTRVRDAAGQITQMAAELHQYHLERYLPTAGVTVILPAMIIHLLEMKSPSPDVRQKATKGFRQCMKVMEKLRDIYAAADFATGFLDAALRKAAIDVNAQAQNAQQQAVLKSLNGAFSTNFTSIHTARSEELSTPPPENAPYLTAAVVEQYTRSRTLAPRHVEANPAVAGSHSPPHTETQSDGAEGTTPSASVSSPEERDAMDLDMVLGQDEFDWNAMAGPNLDFDQWLQFPAEGVNNTDGDFMGMFGTAGPEPPTMGDDHPDMDWLGPAKEMKPEASVAA